MAEQEKNNVPQQQEEEMIIYPLYDPETDTTEEYQLLAEWENDGKLYFAMVPLADEEFEGYVILRVTEDGEGGLNMESIEDDEEFDTVEDYFNDLFFSEVDYDEE